MAWDVEGTKHRIYQAALAEFAAHGPDGTTIDRIARRAQVNRERVYNYYGDKTALFATIVRGEVDALAAAVPLDITGPDDVGEFAGRAYDYQRAHPDLARLVLWEGLADTGAIPDELARTTLYADKAAAIAAAQRAGRIDATLDPAHLMFLVMSLASYWSAAPQIARMLTGSPGSPGSPGGSGGSGDDPDDGAEAARRRAAVVHAARRLATP